MISLIAVALAVLLVPVAGVHRRLAQEKRSELRRVRGAIRSRSRSEALPREAVRFRTLSLADAIAYEARIASVSTWPFDFSALLRFGFYLALGVGSWIGGALVERLLGLALD